MRNKLGFTLVELIVVVGVIGLLTPVLFAVVFGILRQQTKVVALKEVKREGDFVLQTMEQTIRNNATTVQQVVGSSPDPTTDPYVCNVPGVFNGSFYFNDKNGNWFRYQFNSSKVSSSSSVLAQPIDLTSSDVVIQNASITCETPSSFSPPLVAVSFDIITAGTSQRAEDRAKLKYQTKIKLRSY